MDENGGEQPENSKVPKQLQPWMYKKGQSGNPSGRPLGISLKEYARVKFRTMTDDEKEEFFEGIPKIDLFKMAEGNPETKSDITSLGKTINIIVPAVVAEAFEINATTENKELNEETGGSDPEQIPIQSPELGKTVR